jgi:hypothetical protein
MAPRLVPVLTPQPLPMPLEKWIEELERLCRAMDEIALLAERDLKRPSAQGPKSWWLSQMALAGSGKVPVQAGPSGDLPPSPDAPKLPGQKSLKQSEL